MKAAISGKYLPANGLCITASAAARRNGAFATGPPSWKISSNIVHRFRTFTSCMRVAPCGNREFRHEVALSNFLWANNPRLTLQMKRCSGEKTLALQFSRDAHAGLQRFFNLAVLQQPHSSRHAQITKIAVWSNFTRGRSNDRRMTWKIDGIRDNRCSSVGHRRGVREDGHRIRNSQRKTSPSPAARGDSAHRIGGLDLHRAKQGSLIGPLHHSNLETLSRREVQGDIAAVVYIRARQFRARSHRIKNLFRNRSG